MISVLQVSTLLMKNLIFFIKYFLIHQITAVSKYQLHSPFLYEFVTKVVKGKSDRKITETYRSYQGKIKNKQQAISLKKAQVLARLLVLVKPDHILVYSNTSCMFNRIIEQVAPKSEICNIDEGLHSATKKHSDWLVQISQIKQVDFLFYDGMNEKNEMKLFFEKCVSKKGNESIFVFNSIYRSKDMKMAWDFVKSHPQTRLSIDLFSLGIVIFKQELSRQQIKYRY